MDNTKGNSADDFASDAAARAEWQRGIDLVVKVSDLFKEWVGGRAAHLYPTLFPYETRDAIKRALSDEFDAATASRLALHLVDWNGVDSFGSFGSFGKFGSFGTFAFPLPRAPRRACHRLGARV